MCSNPTLINRIFSSILFLAFWVQGEAQDTMPSIKIDSIVITASRLDFETSGTFLYKTLPTISTINQSIGDALSYSTPINFKQYGPGMLQSASARGTGASHLAVQWNGINIQSITHGQVDFGLIGQSEEVSYVPGGNGVMDGSGALGGVVQLNTKIRDKKGLHGYFYSALASFHNSRQGAQIRYQSKKWANLSEINYKKGKNDFPYINFTSVGKPTVTQTNNAYQATNFRQSNQWTINSKNIVNFHYWLTLSDRQIPPSMTSGNDRASQADQSHRFLVEWLAQLNPRLGWQTKLAQITQQLAFQNQSLFSFTATSKQVLDSRLSFHKEQHQLQLGLFQSLEKAASSGYTTLHQRWTSALSLSEKYQLNEQLRFSAQSRLEIKDFTKVMPIYSFAGDYNWNTWAIKGKFGRHFHAPTFNDLFWKELGVPSLKDEIGYQGEISLSHLQKNKNQFLRTNVTAFWLNVNDWILWAPDNTGNWRPSNKKKVVSKGIELNARYSLDYQHFNLVSNIGYTYVNTINKKSIHGNSILNKQLIYVPKHKLNSFLRINYKHLLAFTYSQLFVSKRPYKQDNSKFVPSYAVHNIQLAFIPSIHKVRLHFHLAITNLSNKNYQIIRFRPMPGRGYEAGVKFGLRNLTKQKLERKNIKLTD